MHKNGTFICKCHFFVVPLQAQRFDYLIPSLTDVKQEDIKGVY